MELGLVDFKSVNDDGIFFRHPRKFDSGWYSEVWYRNPDSKTMKLIVKAPRIKVAYGTKEFGEEKRKTYTYCISFIDQDIDQEIQDFLNFVKKCDTLAVKSFKKNKIDWGITVKNKFVYRSALVKKSDKHYHIMKIKLLMGKEGNILTNIRGNNRSEKSYKDIEYGTYLDQYLEFGGLTMTNSGMIYPVWYVHQVVVSRQERVFLDKLLLDEISPSTVAPKPSLYDIPMPVAPTRIPPKICKPTASTISKPPPRPSMMMITASDLLSVKSKLKTVKDKEDEINPQEILNKELMLASVKKISKKPTGTTGT